MGAAPAAPHLRALRHLRVGRHPRTGRGARASRRCEVAAGPDVVRPRARRGEGEQLRERILDAATTLLIDAGDEDAVSMRAVARASGCTPPAIYLHFADKNELFFAVCERQFRDFAAYVRTAVEDVADPLDRLVARGRAYITFALENPEVYQVLFMHKPHVPPEHFDTAAMLADSGFGELVDDVQRGIATGRVADLDPTLVSIGLWTAAHGLCALLISKPSFPWPPLDDLIDHVIGASTRGIAGS